MTEGHDVFVRAYAVAARKQTKKSEKDNRRSQSSDSPRWPRHALVIDTETRTSVDQSLTFGVFRLCELESDKYKLIREGVFYADDLPAKERRLLENYARTAVSEAKSFPPEFPLYSRSQFMQKVFLAAQASEMEL